MDYHNCHLWKDLIIIFSVGGGDKKKNVSTNLIQAIDFALKKKCRTISILGKEQLFTIIGIISLSILVFSPVNYYLSRLIWLNVFIDKTKL